MLLVLVPGMNAQLVFVDITCMANDGSNIYLHRVFFLEWTEC